MRKILIPSFLLALTIALTPAAKAATCDSLASLKLPDTTITMAQSVGAGEFTDPAAKGKGKGGGFANLPAFCRVAMTIKPTSDSDIKVELWLPASNWNRKYQAVGNGGWNGTIDNTAMARELRKGYAAASTDTGHEGGAGVWMQSQEKLIDFGSRAVHEMTLKSKSLINEYYGNNAKLSYFNGCSAGGRQAV